MNHWADCDVSLDQLPRRVLRESSSNARSARQALRIRPTSQHRVLKSQARVTIKQPNSFSRFTDIPPTSEDVAKLEVDYEPRFQWIWARAKQCDRYKNYRKKKRGCRPGDSDGGRRQKDFEWPDDYERVFWKAIVMYPPRERERKKSEQDDNKDLGRNESIAEYLESKFGKNMWGDKKGRKVVSSHIQVLRGHFDLPKAEKEMNPPPPNPFADVLIYFPKKGKKEIEQDYNFEPSDFQMYIRNQRGQGQRLHDITVLRNGPQPTRVSVADVRDRICEFPELKPLLAGGTLRCPVVLAEASFSLPDQEHLTAEKELCIEQCVSTSRSLAPDRVWSTRTRITEPGMEEVSVTEKIKPPQGASAKTHDIKFRSAYWVDLLTRFDAHRRARPSHEYAAGAVDSNSAKINEHLRRIRAVQEIYSSADHGNGVLGISERHLVICWTFRQARYGEMGLTQWQELVIAPTIPTMAQDYPSPDASFKGDGGYNESLDMQFDMYNHSVVPQGLGLQQASEFSQEEWMSPTRMRSLPFYGATVWPSTNQSQSLIPRSYEVPTFDVNQQLVTQGLYGSPEYLPMGSFGMTPPDSALVGNFSQSFNHSTSNDDSQSPEPVHDAQPADYSHGTGYSHIYAPQAQYTHLPLNAPFMYDESLQDFSSFNRIIEADQTVVGGLEYSFQDHVPVLPSQPVDPVSVLDDRHSEADEDVTLSHLRLTAPFDPNFFAEGQPTIMDAPMLPSNNGHDAVMSRLLSQGEQS